MGVFEGGPKTVCLNPCLDSMWHEKELNDIFEAEVKDDHLKLLQEFHRTKYMTVKTKYGLSERT